MTDFYDLFDKPAPTREAGTVTPLDPARATRYAHKALLSECENVAAATEGTRNDTLNRAAFNLSQLVAAGHLPHRDTWEALASAARTCGLDDDEIRTTITSGFRAGTEQPRIVPDLPPPPGVTLLTDDATESEDAPPLNPILDWHELFSTEDNGEEWIVEPILPARRMIALYSAPKAGKSLLMLEIAVAIARGTEVIGATTPDRPRRVLYVDFENDPRGDVRTRLEAMDITPGELDDLCYLTFPSLAKFDTAQGAFDLMRHVEGYACEVVIIDTVSRAVMGEENENDTWLAFYRHTGLALKRAEVACIRLDHSGKDTTKGMRGGSAKYGDVDAVWRLTALSEDTIHLECTDHRMPVPTTSLTLTRQDFPLTHRVAGDSWQAVVDAKTREVDQVLDSLGMPSSASVREAAEALRGAGHKVNNKALREAVRLRKMRLDVTVIEPQGERITPAWAAAVEVLSDGRWHSRATVIETMVEASDILAKTCSNQLSEAVKKGALQQRGEYPDWEIRTLPEGVPGTPPAHPGTPEGSVPGADDPIGSPPAHPQRRAETARHTDVGTDDSDPDLLVSCKSCHRPTTNGVASRQAGLCAACHRDTGQESPPTTTTEAKENR